MDEVTNTSMINSSNISVFHWNHPKESQATRATKEIAFNFKNQCCLVVAAFLSSSEQACIYLYNTCN